MLCFAVLSKRRLFKSYIQVCDGVFDCPQSENSDGGEDEDDETCCESGSGSTDCCGSGSGSSGHLCKLQIVKGLKSPKSRLMVCEGSTNIC